MPEQPVKPEAKQEIEAGGVTAEKGTPAKELSAEEQMALFEKELKEEDWGHQPC